MSAEKKQGLNESENRKANETIRQELVHGQKPISRRAQDNTQKTMTMSLLLSAPGPIFTGIPALLSLSATQIADFLRRSAELVSLFVAWRVYRTISREPDLLAEKKRKLEALSNQVVAAAMFVSAALMLLVSFARLFFYEAKGSVIAGLVIAILGLITNTWFWRKYSKVFKETHDVVVEGQMHLYGAKTAIDACVVAALLAVTLAPEHPVTQYVDAAGCMGVSLYLFYSGVSVLRKVKHG